MNTIKILNEIKNENSTNAKIDLLKKYTSDKQLTMILKLTYDQNIVFGIKKIPEPADNVPHITLISALKNIYYELNDKKLRGNAAKKFVSEQLGGLKPEEQVWFTKILKKDLKIGINRKTIEKVYPGLFERFGYMGAVPFDQKKLDKLLLQDIIVVQEKMDGEYSNLQLKIVDDEITKVNFYSRQNKLQRLPESLINNIKTDIKKFIEQYWIPGNIVFNGELMIKGYDRFTSNGLLSRIFKYEEYVSNGDSKKATEALNIIEQTGQADFNNIVGRIKYFIWDFIDTKQEYKYIDRWNILTDKDNPIINSSTIFEPVKTIIIDQDDVIGSKIKYNFTNDSIIKSEDVLYTKKSINSYFKEVVKQGGEGIIIKSGYGYWKNGKPVYQIKKKGEYECEMEIKGFKQGTSGTKYENSLGALICESSDGKVKADPSGISDDLRNEIWNNKNDFLNKIITVRFNALTKSKDNDYYSLMHPRFIKLRIDKSKADDIKIINKIASDIK